jgi:hypothetical protein
VKRESELEAEKQASEQPKQTTGKSGWLNLKGGSVNWKDKLKFNLSNIKDDMHYRNFAFKFPTKFLGLKK